jgi:hypothetical protein
VVVVKLLYRRERPRGRRGEGPVAVVVAADRGGGEPAVLGGGGGGVR